MKKTVFILALLLCLLFCGCSSGGDPLEYQNFAAAAEVTVNANGTVARANLSLGKPTTDGSPRDAEITFSAPDTLSGITVTRKNGEVMLSLGELSVPSGVGEGFISIADLFSISGTLFSAELCELGGKKATLVKITDSDTIYEIYVSESSLPLRIVKDSLTLDVVWFEYKK